MPRCLAWDALEGRMVLSFAAPVSYPVGTKTTLGLNGFGPQVVTGDFHGDGKLDLAVTNTADGTVSILRGNGNGTFQPAVTSDTGLGAGNPVWLAAADFNGDGKLDLAVEGNNGALSILLGNGNGTFAPAKAYTVGSGDRGGLAVGDYFGNGLQDIAAAIFGNNTVVILPNNGNGTFGSAVVLAMPSSFGALRSIATGNFFGNGHADLAVAGGMGYNNVNSSPDPAGVALFEDDGHGHFTYGAEYVAATTPDPSGGNGQGDTVNPEHVNAADLNGDGKPDLVLSLYDHNIDVFLNNGNGTFQPAIAYATETPGALGGYPRGVAFGDFNGDGKVDIASLNFGEPTPADQSTPQPGSVGVLYGNGDGTFQAPIQYTPYPLPGGLAVADFNGDGLPDLAVTQNYTGHSVSVLLNQPNTATQPPTITGVSPAAGPTTGGTQVAITGTNFTGATQVDIGGAIATAFTVNSDTSITATVPSGPAGTVDITVYNAGASAVGPADRFTYQIPSLTVIALTPTSTGFTATFSEPFKLAPLNLHDTATAGLGPADVTLVGASTGPVRGSLIVSAGDQVITFARTDGVLAPDTYTLTLRSAANGFEDNSGNLLAGDGTPGDNDSATFVDAPSSARVLAVPDFARGPGQAVNVPATGAGLPLTISDGSGVTSISLSLTYNPSLLTITGANPGPGAPAGSSVTINTSTPGLAVLNFTSPTALPAGLDNFATLVASVPNAAPYASKEALAIGNMIVDGGSIAATDGDGVHVVAYLGDTTGNGGYSSLDATLVRRVIANVDTGFVAYPLLDPTILGDIAGTGSLTALDATYLTQYEANIPQPRIPPLPGVTIVAGGPDPLIWLPQDITASPGSSLTVPVMFRQTNGSAIGLDSANLAIEFDPSVFMVTGVRLGGVTQGFTLTESYDNATGAIIASLRSPTGAIELAPGAEGMLLLVDLAVRPGAALGAARINLLDEGRVGSTVLDTSLNDGNLTLTPAPTDSDLDPTDGLVTVTTLATLQPDATASMVVGASEEVPATTASPSRPGPTTWIETQRPALIVPGALDAPPPGESIPTDLIPWTPTDPTVVPVEEAGSPAISTRKTTGDSRVLLTAVTPSRPVFHRGAGPLGHPLS